MVNPVLPRDINLIIFPDWTTPETMLSIELERLLKDLFSHPERDRITLFIYAGEVDLEDVNLLISATTMNLLMKTDIELAESIDISLLDDLSDLAQYHARILISCENARLFPESLKSLEIEALRHIHTPQLILSLAERLFQASQWQGASEQYEKYLDTDIGDVQVYLHLAECYRYLEQWEKRLNTFKRGIEQYSLEPRLYFSAIVHLQREGRAEEAIQLAQQARDRIPDDYTFKILDCLLVPAIYQSPAEIEFYRDRFTTGLNRLIQETSLSTPEELSNVLAGITRLTNFYISYQAQNDVELQKKYGQFLHQVVTASYPQWNVPLTMPDLKQGKIRVGYVSAYLHSYSGTLWLTGWLKYANRDKLEIYCYYTGNSPDVVTEQFQEYSDYFYHIPYNIEETARQIRSDNLHILVYPELGMDASTFVMAGLRLAPVQCTAWGHPVTTGLPTIDYFLSSELMEPENAEEHYSETLIRLPNIGVAYPKPKIPPLIKSRTDYGLVEDSVLYFCCQAPVKYLPQYDYVFPEIARQVPKAKFLFLRGELLKPRLKRVFATRELDYRSYCEFLRIPERLDYLLLNLLSDVYLDTITWSGGNTSLEAIACHLPIVTYPGEFMRGRHTDSFLKRIDVTDTIARSEEEYIEIAVRLGRDRAWREAIKGKMRERCDRLYDDIECVRGLETFYQNVVQNQ